MHSTPNPILVKKFHCQPKFFNYQQIFSTVSRSNMDVTQPATPHRPSPGSPCKGRLPGTAGMVHQPERTSHCYRFLLHMLLVVTLNRHTTITHRDDTDYTTGDNLSTHDTQPLSGYDYSQPLCHHVFGHDHLTLLLKNTVPHRNHMGTLERISNHLV